MVLGGMAERSVRFNGVAGAGLAAGYGYLGCRGRFSMGDRGSGVRRSVAVERLRVRAYWVKSKRIWRGFRLSFAGTGDQPPGGTRYD